MSFLFKLRIFLRNLAITSCIFLFAEQITFGSNNKYIDSLLNVTVKGNFSEKSSAFCSLAFYYLDSLDNTSLFFANEALYYAKLCNNNNNIAFAYIMIASFELNKSNFQKALKYYQKAEYYAAIDSNYFQLHTIYNNIGIIYKNLNEHSLAIDKFSKALNYAYLTNDIQSIIQTYINLGDVSFMTNKKLKALDFYNKAVSYCSKEPDNFFYELAILHNNIGTIYYKNKDFILAKSYYNKSLEIFLKHNYYYGLQIIYNNLAEIEFSQKNFQKAEEYIFLSDSLNALTNNLESQKNLYYTAYQIYKNINNYKKALDYFEKFHQLKDSIYNIDFKKTIEETKAKYELDKAETYISYQNKLLEQKQNSENLFKFLIITLLLFIILLIYITYIKIQSFKKLNILNNKLTFALSEIDNNLEYSQKILKNITEPEKLNKEYFVFEKPKMRVGGDYFYGGNNKYAQYYILADCTGHGVSAAFLTLISITSIKECIKKNYSPAEICNQLNLTFQKNINNENFLKESLAISIIKITDNKTEFSGSKQRIWIYKNNSNDIIEIKSQNKIIGYDTLNEFNNIELMLQKNDIIYLSSDGFPDQFNNENTQKLKYTGFKNVLMECVKEEFGEKQKLYLINFLNKWKGNNEQTDDIIVAAVKI